MLLGGTFYSSNFKTMSLDSISKDDAIPMKKEVAVRTPGTLNSQDIEGAQPQLRGYKHFNKPSFNNHVFDIDRAQPRTLHEGLNKPEFNLNTNDIERSKPKVTAFTTTRLGNNPLNPNYKLQSVEYRPHTPPKFLRDAIETNDIEGSKPETMYKWQQRDVINVHDIDGARPKPEKHYQKPNFQDPSDINAKEKDLSTRSVNPLDPVYVIRDEDGNLTTTGEIQGSKPKAWVKMDKSTHERNLKCEDIEGAAPNEFGIGNIQRARATPKNPSDISDIVGTQANSRKKNFETTRTTNPLDPQYQEIGASEEQENNFYQTTESIAVKKDPEMEKATTNFYGIDPRKSSASSRQRPQTTNSVRKPPIPSGTSEMERRGSFQRNAKHFFNHGQESEPSTPGSNARRLEKNAEAFYAGVGTPGRAPQVTLNPTSIHRPVKIQQAVNVDGKEFSQDVKTFYAMDPEPHTYKQCLGVGLNVGRRPPSAPASSCGRSIASQQYQDIQSPAPASSYSNRSQASVSQQNAGLRLATPSSQAQRSQQSAAGLRSNSGGRSQQSGVRRPPSAGSQEKPPTPSSSGYKFSMDRNKIGTPLRPPSAASSLHSAGSRQ